MLYVLTSVLGILSGIGTLTLAKWLRELWRTRKDDRHDIDTRDTGAL